MKLVLLIRCMKIRCLNICVYMYMFYSVFEGVERAARALKEEVLTSLCNESSQKERALREASAMVGKRRTDITDQLATRKREVDAVQQLLINAVTQRCDELRAALEAAAAEKTAALASQRLGLDLEAGSLQEAREGAQQTLSSLVVEERPIEVVTACLRLKKELAAINKASQAKAPVCEANLHVVLTTVNVLVGGVRQFGWSGALDVDVAKCTLDKQGEALCVQPGGSFKIMLTTRDKLGQQLKAGGLAVTASVEPAATVDGSVAVKDMGDGTYAISFKTKAFEGNSAMTHPALSIEVCGSAISCSPLAIASFPSRIVTTQADVKALHGFVPGKRLELCYRASRDGWTAADFHRLCDGKGPTLVLAKEETKGYIFGGHTTVAWSSNVNWGGGNAANDQHAFLFSICNPSSVKPFKMPFKGGGNGYTAVYHDPSTGPRFGNHGDLALLTDGHSRCGTSQLGCSYELRTDRLGPTLRFGHLARVSRSQQVQQAQNFLAGADWFTLAELEVYLVN
jgi:hypothetical protein